MNTQPESIEKKYEIVTLRDILDIPEDRMDAFLVDLKMWHSTVSNTLKLIDEASKIVEPEKDIRTKVSKMVWIDDGKHNATLKIDY